MDIEVLYEDTDVVVINKPAGLIMHSDGRTEEPSVAEWMVKHYPQSAGVGEPWVSPQGAIIARPGIVHRLDRGTSGVVVLAKTQEAYEFLKAQFQGRTAQKTYRALVYGQPGPDHGTIEAEIVRIRSTPPRWGVARAGEERTHRAAITLWQVLSRATDPESGEKVSYLEARPKTGRTHQIRVHLKHLGYPVICDPLYAKGRPCLLGFTRAALHAYSLSIQLPSHALHSLGDEGGEQRTFDAPLPADFTDALRRLS